MSRLAAIKQGWRKLGFWRWVGLALIVGVAWWLWGRKPVDPASQVITAVVSKGDVEVSVLATGVVDAAKTVEVGAQASGQIQHLAVALGDRVKKGDLLAEIDPSVTKTEFDAAQSAIDGLEAQQTVRQLALDEAEQELARQQLMLSGDATARKEFDAAQLAVKTRRAEIRMIAAQLKEAQVRLEKARTNLGFTRIVAPMDGVVTAIAAKEGQTVNAIQSAPPILTLAAMDNMQVKAQVAEADIVRLKPGTPLYFSVLGAPERRFEAKISGIEPTPQTINNAIFYNALFLVPNQQGLLRLQMTAQVTFLLDRARNVLTVPVAALSQPKGQLYTVTVLEADGQLRTRQVEIGVKGNVNAEVRKGLQAGEKVVVSRADSSKKPGDDGHPEPEPGHG
ncbi:macrolide transporter subunit MacA [Chitinibacter tainanensis]|uniref:macrolide transporter subunit MacA n=1 Tax=Chitinibacter tainanensis TaxID=230667 RepID=UPI0004293267|nr:macrolide transporter subunit MacA [Chitinibacter tainanensis]